jgi:hypothetical protein
MQGLLPPWTERALVSRMFNRLNRDDKINGDIPRMSSRERDGVFPNCGCIGYCLPDPGEQPSIKLRGNFCRDYQEAIPPSQVTCQHEVDQEQTRMVLAGKSKILSEVRTI